MHYYSIVLKIPTEGKMRMVVVPGKYHHPYLIDNSDPLKIDNGQSWQQPHE